MVRAVAKLAFGAAVFVLLAGTLIYSQPQHANMRRASAAWPRVSDAVAGDPRWDVRVWGGTSGRVTVEGDVRIAHEAELRRRAVLAAGDVPVVFNLALYDEQNWETYQRAKAEWTRSASAAAR